MCLALPFPGKPERGCPRPRSTTCCRRSSAWFEQRGFKGAMDIDQLCVRLEQVHHQAIHGGGNWRLGRISPGEWNRKVMDTLLDVESRIGRMLTRNENLDIVAENMKNYRISMIFVSGEKR